MRLGALYASMADQKRHPSPFASHHGEWGPYLLGAHLKVEGKEAVSWGESRGRGAGRHPRGHPSLRPHSRQQAGDIYQPSAPRDVSYSGRCKCLWRSPGKAASCAGQGHWGLPAHSPSAAPRVALRSNSDQIWGTQGLAAHLTVSLSPFSSASQACTCAQKVLSQRSSACPLGPQGRLGRGAKPARAMRERIPVCGAWGGAGCSRASSQNSPRSPHPPHCWAQPGNPPRHPLRADMGQAQYQLLWFLRVSQEPQEAMGLRNRK